MVFIEITNYNSAFSLIIYCNTHKEVKLDDELRNEKYRKLVCKSIGIYKVQIILSLKVMKKFARFF